MTGRIARRGNKRDTLARFRLTFTGTAIETGMRDDLKALGAALAEEYGQAPLDERHTIEWLTQWGRITPQDAEDWLKAQDPNKREAPFAEEPDPAKFDPFAEAYWTLGMVTAWVLWGTADAVRNEWPEFISRRWEWRPYNEIEAHEKAPGGRLRVRGHVLHQGEAKGAWGVLAFASANPAGLRTTPEDAKRAIVSALQRRSDLPVVQGRDEHVREVPAITWVGLSPFTPGRRELPDDVYARGERDSKLSNVKVWSADVLRLWPAETPEAEVSDPPEPVEAAPEVRPLDGVVEESALAAEAPADVQHKVVEETLDAGIMVLAKPVSEAEMDGGIVLKEISTDMSTSIPSVNLPSAGRPSLAHLYEPEYRRRAISGKALGSEREAAILRKWLSRQIDKGEIDLGDHALPSVSGIKKNVQRWRKEEKERTETGPK